MSLRTIHLIFMTLVIVGADLIGVWLLHDYAQMHDPAMLTCGVATILGGFGLVGYIIWFVQKTEKAHLY